MTAAVAGAAGRGAAAAGGGRAAASGGGARAAARRPRARNIDERSQRAGERFDQRWSREGAADKRPPRRGRQPSSEGYMDAVQAGGEKRDNDSSGGQSSGNSEPTRPVQVNMPGPVSSGAGFILAVLFWSWVALPFLKGGPTGVRNMLRAKFLNKGADGSWLP